MYEFHGWVRLEVSTNDAEELNDDDLSLRLSNLRRHLSKLDWMSGKAELLLLNGKYTLVLNACPNRRSFEAVELDELIQFVVKEYPGSFGIVYEFDEQREALGGMGVFIIRIIKRGTCELRFDPFLTPKFPVVEDAL